MTRYREWLKLQRGLALGGYHELWRWSVDELEAFWASIWEFFDVSAAAVRARARPPRDAGRGVVPRRAAQLRRARLPRPRRRARRDRRTPPSCDRRRGGRGASCARVTGAIAAALRALGVGPGDRVAAYLPNIPEAVAAFLALRPHRRGLVELLARLRRARVVDRFAQIEPKVLLAVDGYRYGGSDFDRARRGRRARAASCRRRAHGAAAVPRPGAGSTGRSWDELAAAPRRSSSRSCRSTIRCGCSTRRARPACRRRSSTARAGSCSST